MGPMSYQYFYVSGLLLIYSLQPLMDDFMQAQAMDKPKMLRMWTWDDSTRIVNFMTMHLM